MFRLHGPLLLSAVLMTSGCSNDQGHEVDTGAATTITVSSPAFSEGDELPTQFTCDGEGLSPPLEWSGGQGEAWPLVVDDPDAPGGTYVHWVVADIAARATSVERGEVPTSGVQVVNSSDEATYAAPCPPSGEHRFRFTIYALDTPLGLTENVSLDEALDAISGHATSLGSITGVYSRS